MTISEMHTLFKLKLDKTNSLSYPSFEDEEVDLWLNQAQEMFVKTRYSGNNPYRTAVEETQKRSDDLRNLIKESVIGSPVTSDNFSSLDVKIWQFTLPSDYLFSLSESLTFTYTCEGSTTTKESIVKAIGSGSWRTMTKDPFNRPNKERVLRMMNNGVVDVLVDNNSTPVSLYMKYLKKPSNVVLSSSTDCELADHTHSEIVDLAVNLAIENIESPRVQTAPQVSSKIE